MNNEWILFIFENRTLISSCFNVPMRRVYWVLLRFSISLVATNVSFRREKLCGRSVSAVSAVFESRAPTGRRERCGRARAVYAAAWDPGRNIHNLWHNSGQVARPTATATSCLSARPPFVYRRTRTYARMMIPWYPESDFQ